MRLDPNPLFRRIIMPWYDSLTMCWAVLVAMVAFSLFSLAGISVARQIPEYNRYQWLPWLLLILCLFVGASICVRLVRRYHQQKNTEI